VRRGWIATAACAALATAAATVVLLRNGSEIGPALDRIPLAVFVLAVGLHGLMLLARTEAWRLVLTVAAEGRAPPRVPAHAASAVGFIVGAVETPAALPVRMALLRRLSPNGAPSVRAMAFGDMPVFALEGVFAALLLVPAAPALGLPWWSGPLAIALMAAIVLAMRLGHARMAHHPLAAGFAVLGERSVRPRLLALVSAVVGLTILRVWLLAAACGLPHGPMDAALLYLAVSVIGLLPIGPASSPAATIAVSGSAAGVGAAGAAGLAVSASSILAVLVYAGVALLVHAVGGVRRAVGGLCRRSHRSPRASAESDQAAR
jgi:hypothetical protein